MKKLLAFLAALPFTFSLSGLSSFDRDDAIALILFILGTGLVVLVGMFVFGIGAP